MLANVSPAGYGFAGLAAFVAGVINAIAGGGSLVSFPALLALGVTPVAASVTNTVSLCPGYLGGAVALKPTLTGQRARAKRLAPAAASGALIGGFLLLRSGDSSFDRLVPFLILGACALLLLQEPLKARLARHPDPDRLPGPAALAAVAAGSVYGGYFGAGLGILLLAVLGLVLDDTLARLNGLKAVITTIVNTVAALFFLSSDEVRWNLVLPMAIGSLLGGALGGRVARHIPARPLRYAVVTFGVVVALGKLI